MDSATEGVTGDSEYEFIGIIVLVAKRVQSVAASIPVVVIPC